MAIGLSLPVRQVDRTSAADDVRAQLLGLIQEGELPIGTKLPSEHEMARSFGVSRTVVREGLGTLRSMGLLESRAGAGTFVRATRPVFGGLLLGGKITSDELHEVRCHIEIPGAGLAALRRTDEQLHRLEEIVDRHARPGGPDTWVGDDLLFHVSLAEATGNILHKRFVEELQDLQSELSITMSQIAGGLAAPLHEHATIVQAVHRRDEDAAREAMRAHLAAIQGRSKGLRG